MATLSFKKIKMLRTKTELLPNKPKLDLRNLKHKFLNTTLILNKQNNEIIVISHQNLLKTFYKKQFVVI